MQRIDFVHYQRWPTGWTVGFIDMDCDNPRYFNHPTDASMKRLAYVLNGQYHGLDVEEPLPIEHYPEGLERDFHAKWQGLEI